MSSQRWVTVFCTLTPFSVLSTFRHSTLKKKSACFLRGFVPAYQNYIQSYATNNSYQREKSGCRRSMLFAFCGSYFSHNRTYVFEAVKLTFLLQGNLNIILFRVVTDLVAAEQAVCINYLWRRNHDAFEQDCVCNYAMHNNLFFIKISLLNWRVVGEIQARRHLSRSNLSWCWNFK